MRNRFLPLTYAILISALILVGCTSREDPAETLDLCGNHACGELVMVTADTSSEGFHYLNPSLSPDGSRILFTADWTAFPSANQYNEDDFYTNFRQMIVIPLSRQVEPMTSLAEEGARLLKLKERNLAEFNVQGEYLSGVVNSRKGDPIWEDDSHVIFRLELSRGYRLFRADIADPDTCRLEPLYFEELDRVQSGRFYQHFEPALSPDGRWLAFTRSSCLIPDSLETCTQSELMVLDMATAGDGNAFDAVAFPVTREVSRLERPSWSPDGSKIVFSAGLDLAGEAEWGTELYTIDFDTTGMAANLVALDNHLTRLTFTDYDAGDPIAGVFNTSPRYSNDGQRIYFVSTRRMPTTTHHDRNIWVMPADGSLDPEIYFFTRSDDVDPSINPDGSLLLSSQMGFTTEMLNFLEEEAYQRARQVNQERIADPNNDEAILTELEMRDVADDKRKTLELFEGVMSHLYVYRR